MPAPGPKDGHASKASRDLGGRRGLTREIKNVSVKSNGFKGGEPGRRRDDESRTRGRAAGRGRLGALGRGATAIARAVPGGRGGEGGEGRRGTVGEEARARGGGGGDGDDDDDDDGGDGDDDDDDGGGGGRGWKATSWRRNRTTHTSREARTITFATCARVSVGRGTTMRRTWRRNDIVRTGTRLEDAKFWPR